MVYVSITGLQLKTILHGPVFWWHAIRSMAQAKSAPGLISAQARQMDGVHHTLTLWADQADMRRYLTCGAHLAAMRAFQGIATGRTIGFHAETAPDWDEVHRIWLDRGRPVRPGA